jgi:hypothetical protein
MAYRPAPPERKYLTTGDLERRWGCSHMTVERLIRSDPDFPPYSRFSGRVRRFTIDEIETYERSKVVVKAVA